MNDRMVDWRKISCEVRLAAQIIPKLRRSRSCQHAGDSDSDSESEVELELLALAVAATQSWHSDAVRLTQSRLYLRGGYTLYFLPLLPYDDDLLS